MSQTTRMPRCTWCGAHVSRLWRVYGTAMKLETCGWCSRVADPLLERDVVFLWLHTLLLDLRVFRHLVHNIQYRSDGLAQAGWKTLARIHLFVLLLAAAYLYYVAPPRPLSHALAHLGRAAPFPEYHPLMLPLLCAAAAQAVGWACMWAALVLLVQLRTGSGHRGRLTSPQGRRAVASDDHGTRSRTPKADRPLVLRALLLFQLAQLWLPAMATACLFAQDMSGAAPRILFRWAANALQALLTGVLLHVSGDISLHTGCSIALLIVLCMCVCQHQAAITLSSLVTSTAS